MKYCSIDIETTGLDPEKHNIVEFGCVIDDTDKPFEPISALPSFHTYNVLDDYIGQPYALSMHSTIFKRISDKDPAFNYSYNGKMGSEFFKFLKSNGFEENEFGKIYVNCAGKNFGTFDLQFLNRYTDIRDYRIKFRHRIIDPSVLYFRYDDNELPDMEKCLERAGLRSTVSHTAIEDAKDVIRLIRRYNFPNINIFE